MSKKYPTPKIFTPKNPSKYKGDFNKIVARSSWELKFMRYVDIHPDILGWSSESLIIKYISPIDKKVHRYFPDFLIKKRARDGKISTVLIEIKPYIQTKPPIKKTSINRRYIQEVMTWGVNEAKWTAARQYCTQVGWEFSILTEKELNITW